jgi:hypothetical protein
LFGLFVCVCVCFFLCVCVCCLLVLFGLFALCGCLLVSVFVCLVLLVCLFVCSFVRSQRQPNILVYLQIGFRGKKKVTSGKCTAMHFHDVIIYEL